MTTAERGGVIGFEHDVMLDDKAAQAGATALGGFLKRTIDLAAAALLIVVMSPLFLFTALAIRLTTPGPVLFGHERIGLGGRSFRCWKFRTMESDADARLREHLATCPTARAEWATHRKLRNDPRVTPLGQVLREYSVDELPQLLNVIRGDMSLVGPRPVVAEELAGYGAEAKHYCAARPGITGLWQVSGRSDTEFTRRIELDAQYVRTWSLWTDLAILARTVPAVLGARGSY
jgi:exopolysaccharide production protein ExoY